VPTQIDNLSNDQLLALALDQRTAGELAGMAATLDHLLQRQPDAGLRRRATFHVAEARLLGGDPAGATEVLRSFIADGPADEWTARTHFLLARAYEQAGLHAEAIATYRHYRSLNTILAPYAAKRQAAQEAAVGDTVAMIANLEAAGAEQIAPTQRAEILETLIKHYGEQGQPDLQLARYKDLLALARRPDYRAGLLLRAAAVAAESGNTEAQRNWLRELVETYPESPEAPAAVGLLEESGDPVAAYQAGRIVFLHGKNEEAIKYFDAALASELTDADRFEARRLRALARRGTGAFEEALAELGDLAGGGGATPAQRQAELDYIQTVGQSGNIEWAIGGYRRFATAYPEDTLTPEALWRASQLQESTDPEAAMQAALDLGRLFKTTDQAHAALRKAAVYFRNKDRLPEAITAWRLLGEGAKGWDAAEGHFWAAMTLMEGKDRSGALEQMRAAAAAAPETYYGVRAREFLGERGAGTARLSATIDRETWQQAAAWIGEWTGRPPASDVDQTLADFAATPEVARARELGLLGLHEEARQEWLAALERWNEAPEQQWYLGSLAFADHQPDIAIKAGERLVALSPAGRIAPETPRGVLHLLFPTPYARVARQEAEQASIDPRLLYAVLRQESRFRPDVTSWVGARGLAQVMPATAEGIAAALGIADFHVDQLYSPAVSLRFGAFYLGQQMRAFDNSIQAAAAAYNGGPGNAERWLAASSHPDYFTELIDYRETREYVKIVYGNWGMYRMLYGE
jgi:soluble lytic murein transglycosylase